jgi:hypothetical protein
MKFSEKEICDIWEERLAGKQTKKMPIVNELIEDGMTDKIPLEERLRLNIYILKDDAYTLSKFLEGNAEIIMTCQVK